MAHALCIAASLGGLTAFLAPTDAATAVTTSILPDSSSQTNIKFRSERCHVDRAVRSGSSGWEGISTRGGQCRHNIDNREISGGGNPIEGELVGSSAGLGIQERCRMRRRCPRGWSWFGLRGGSTATAPGTSLDIEPDIDEVRDTPRDVKVLVSTTKISSYVDAVSEKILSPCSMDIAR